MPQSFAPSSEVVMPARFALTTHDVGPMPSVVPLMPQVAVLMPQVAVLMPSVVSPMPKVAALMSPIAALMSQAAALMPQAGPLIAPAPQTGGETVAQACPHRALVRSGSLVHLC
jgi:hypothetical protein